MLEFSYLLPPTGNYPESRKMTMNPTAFEEIYAIMEASFPVTEIRTFSGQKSLLSHPHYRLHTELDTENRIQAFLAAWEFPELRFVEHLAVNPEIRGGGIGKRLMQAYLALTDKPVVLEVEPPENELAERRIGFYERLGFHLNPFDYVQPPLREGQADLPLRVMTYPRQVTLQEFRMFRDILYTEVYNIPVPGRRR